MKSKARSNRTIFLALLVLASFGLVINVAAQEPEQKESNQDVIKIKIDLVQVRAVVTDKSGRVVDNLKQDDFEVLENGKPQRIGFFSLENISQRQTSVDPAPNSTATAPLVLLAARAKKRRSRPVLRQKR